MGLPLYVIALQMRSGNFSQQLIEKAATYYKSLIAAPPSDPLSQLATQQLADLFLRNNQFEQAVYTLGTLVDSTGKVFPEPLLAMADLYLVRQGDFAKSRETFDRFVQLYPSHELTPFAKYGVGRTYYEQKQYQKALEVFDKVKADYALNPRVVPATQFQVGLTYFKMGNWERAKTELDWLIINYPDSPEGMKAAPFIADFYRGRNNPELAKIYFEKAVKQYNEIIQKDPKSSAAYAATQLMTEVYLTQERWQEAANTLEDHLQANPNSPANAEVLILLGQLYEEKLKNKDKANRTYATFLMKFPQDPRAKEALERAKRLSLEMQEEGGQKLPGE
jgi:TolA-binding protein